MTYLLALLSGAAGYFAIFLCGPIGGVAGLVIATVWVLRQRGVRSLGGVVAYFRLVVVALAGLTAGGRWDRVAHQQKPNAGKLGPASAAPGPATAMRFDIGRLGSAKTDRIGCGTPTA